MWSFTFRHAICPPQSQTAHSQRNTHSSFSLGKCPQTLCPIFISLAVLLTFLKRTWQINGLPKWQACAYHGIYIGYSNLHLSGIAMIWNPITKLFSVQYHVIFQKVFRQFHLLAAFSIMLLCNLPLAHY